MSRVLDLIAALTGNRTTGEATGLFTPPQLDNDKSVPTTEFVQRALGNASDLVVVSAATVLDSTYAGKTIVIGGGGFSITLPPSANLPLGGAVFRIINSGTSAVTLLASGSDTLDPGPGTVASLSVGVGEEAVCHFQKSTPGRWYISGSAQLRHAAGFTNLVAATGHHQLPGGLILNWGPSGTVASGSNVTVDFARAFPTGALAAFTTYYEPNVSITAGSVYIGQVRGLSASAITIRNLGPGAAFYHWLALGY